MRVAAKLKLARAHTAPDEERSGDGDNQKGDKLLPVHVAKMAEESLKRK